MTAMTTLAKSVGRNDSSRGTLGPMNEVRRSDDDELCGFTIARSDGWHALSVFGGFLGVYEARAEADRRVRTDGLASLAERWRLIGRSGADEEIVCIQEASPAGVTVALDYYSMPGVPTLTIRRAQLDDGTFELRLP
jgi:hypothetical protein